MSQAQPVYDTVERARGHWRHILRAIGIEHHYLTNKHGPCPLCGGKDRYRFDDKNGEGTYFCSQCGPGAGIILVRKFLRVDHRTACGRVDEIIGNVQPDYDPALQPRRPQAKDPSNRLAAIERVICDATDPATVMLYLAKRGLSVSSPVLRGHRALSYFDDETKRPAGNFPAVIAPIIGADGSLQSVTRIYDADVSPRKKMMPPVDTIKGGAVRLHEPEDGALAVGEGVETCLAVRELYGFATWATLSDIGLMAFEPPAHVTTLRIFGDHDSNFVGQAAAYALAKKQSTNARRKINVEVFIPEIPDTDWLDVLNARKAGGS
jgi:putative DNA primase/helicase